MIGSLPKVGYTSTALQQNIHSKTHKHPLPPHTTNHHGHPLLLLLYYPHHPMIYAAGRDPFVCCPPSPAHGRPGPLLLAARFARAEERDATQTPQGQRPSRDRRPENTRVCRAMTATRGLRGLRGALGRLHLGEGCITGIHWWLHRYTDGLVTSRRRVALPMDNGRREWLRDLCSAVNKYIGVRGYTSMGKYLSYRCRKGGIFTALDDSACRAISSSLGHTSFRRAFPS